MATFLAPEFSGLPYAVPPDCSYDEILVEALSEQRIASRNCEITRYAKLSYSVANACRRIGRLDLAIENYRVALSIFHASDNPQGAGWACWGIGNFCQNTGKYDKAVSAFRRALDYAARSRDDNCFRYSLAGLAEVTRIKRRYGLAVKQHLYARTLFQSVGDWRGVVWANEGLAQIFLRTNRLEAAEAYFSNALRMASQTGESRGIAWAYRGLGEIALKKGRHGDAIISATRSMDEFHRIGMKIGKGYSALTIARSYRQLGETDVSISYINQAKDLFTRCGHGRGLNFAGEEEVLIAGAAPHRSVG